MTREDRQPAEDLERTDSDADEAGDAETAEGVIEDDDQAWVEPAPVVTDEGVYGTLPDRAVVFREYQRQERPWRDTWIRVAGMILAVTAGLWLVFLSAGEATSEEVARPALETLTDTMVGLPGLLELHATEISDATGNAQVPGYPLPVTIPSDEVNAGPERWREVLLEQSSALLYLEGPDALANGDTGGGGTFSTTGGTRLLMENLTQSRHDSLSFLVWPLAIAAFVSAIAIVAVGSSFGRFVALGLAVAAAGIPAIGLGALSWALVAFVGSDGSALAEAGHGIASDLAWLPLRNGLTFLAAGMAVAVAARLMGAIFKPESRPIVQRETVEE